MQNLKITALSDAAFRLWVRGLCYCQTALTDGLIPRTALRDMGAKRAAVTELATTSVPGRAPLWEPHAMGFQVHDYLRWNDCRDKVKDRQAQAAERKAAYQRRQQATRQERNQNAFRTLNEQSTPNQTKPNQRQELKEREEPRVTARVSLSPPADPFLDPEVTERAGRFLERYQVLYQQHRWGARYALKPHRDYAAAVTLCQTWTDDARLDRLAVIFLESDHKFAAEGSRTVPQFLALASWCDGELAAYEATHGAIA